MKIIAKKSLGQNFLNSGKIVEEVVELAGVKAGDVILEVGPGKGILTEILLSTVCPKLSLGQGLGQGDCGRVVAVEKDDQLFEFLREKFASEIAGGKLVLVHGDILNFDPAKYEILNTKYTVVANIPFYLTGHLLRLFLQGLPAGHQPESMTLIIQKEVGERIFGRSEKSKKTKESILSISVKAYGEPKIVKNISAKHFSPQPKVDSVVLKISGISKDFFITNNMDEKKFFGLMKAGFAGKRKTLKNNLKSVLEAENAAKIIEKCGIPEKARAEDLSLENWKCLIQELPLDKLKN